MFLHMFCNFFIFKRNSDFFRKKTSEKRWKTIIKNYIISYAFYRKFASSNNFEKIQIFLTKLFFSKKDPVILRLEKFYLSSRLLRQICNNLVMKRFHIQNCHYCHHFARDKDDTIWQKR